MKFLVSQQFQHGVAECPDGEAGGDADRPDDAQRQRQDVRRLFLGLRHHDGKFVAAAGDGYEGHVERPEQGEEAEVARIVEAHQNRVGQDRQNLGQGGARRQDRDVFHEGSAKDPKCCTRQTVTVDLGRQ